MRLRSRLARNSLIASTVGMLLIFYGTSFWRQQQADQTLAAAIETVMARGGRTQCEASPAHFGGGEIEPLPPIALFFLKNVSAARPQLFAYDAQFRSANPEAPPFPEMLKAALADGGRHATEGWFPVPANIGRQLALRMSWSDGPCTIVLGRFGAFLLPVSTQIFRLFLVLIVVGSVAFVSARSTITRIQRLGDAVRRSAESMYMVDVPVTGRDEIGDLERAFNRAAEQVKRQLDTIEDREAALRSVVSNTAHDVAVPLTVIQGHLSALQSLLPAGGPAEAGLRGAIREAHYLGALLHNLGVAARLDRPASPLERRPVDLNALVGRVVARHNPLAATLDVEIGAAVPETPVTVSADVTLLEQAASNLVHNAVHYNKPGGHVAVVLDTAGGGRRFSLRVIDDGPGIPEEERAQLTEPSFRGASGRSRRPEGQGLGLHIVREVIERHGFDLYIGISEYGGAEIGIDGVEGVTRGTTAQAD